MPPFDTRAWLLTLKDERGNVENCTHFWANDPSTLISSSYAEVLHVASGKDIYLSTILPAIEAAEHEVVLVTCFWAPSDTLTHLSTSLLKLSQKALARGNQSRIRVNLCLSSRSLVQKLFHTSSKNGFVYYPAEWSSKLGLPPQKELQGLDVEVKSLFFRPFSVMHPKFVIVDRTRAFMPSCNLSWEVWLECCLTLRGQIVASLISFWRETWNAGDEEGALLDSTLATLLQTDEVDNSSNLIAQRSNLLSSSPVSTVLLPSPYHNSLKLSIPMIRSISSPPTPLNTFLLLFMSSARIKIQMVTPNLTSPPVISALLKALQRGVDVHITTNRRMMIVEQLVTAGTISEIAVWKFVRRYKSLFRQVQRGDFEDGRRLGRLRIEYYRPNANYRTIPVKVHVKCAVVDGEAVVLGSGNMDRASWYTSQELGIAVFGEEIVNKIWNNLAEELAGKVQLRFQSRACP